MYRYKIIVIAMFLCIRPVMQTQANSEDKVVVNNKVGAPTITVTNLDINDKTLKLSYKIRNDSERNVWILVGFGKTGMSAEVFMDRDDRTLLIRERFDVPFGGGGEIAYGRYVLLSTGQNQTESVTLATPVNPEYGFVDRPLRQERGLEYATRLAIEIGYYAGDLPGMISGILEKADKIGNKTKSRDDEIIRYYFKGSMYFNKVSEILRQRDEEVLVPYTYQWFKGEQVLRTVVEDVRIPYKEKSDRIRIHYSLDIPHCTQVEIQYKPSMLEYFFPYAGHQNLLSQAEKEYLQSIKTTVVDDSQALNAFIDNINKGVPTSGIVRERSMANVVCYRNDKHLTSFPIYNDDSVVVGEMDRFKYDEGFKSLRMLTPQIQPFEFRVQCAANLRNLWYRLRLCYKTEKTSPLDSSGKTKMIYPVPTYWCGAIVRACRTIRMFHNEDIIGPFICPGTGDGKKNLAKSYYAMNPDCKPNSSPDMVLLFETKAGWNQHGGFELFTFDNHDPKGGCVLLNDGTVKFIRTKEELQQLRWK